MTPQEKRELQEMIRDAVTAAYGAAAASWIAVILNIAMWFVVRGGG